MAFTTTHDAFAWFSDRWEHITYSLERMHPKMPLVFYVSVAGFLGFIVKRYMQSLLNSLLLTTVFIGVAHYFGFISLDLAKINQLFGLSSHYSLQSYSIATIAWIKNNTLISAWCAGGFFVGYSLA